LKKPDFASATIEAAAFGAAFVSSCIVKLPQFVTTVSLYVFPDASGALGFFWPPSGFGAGFWTLLQPAGVELACVGVAVLGPPAGMSDVLVLPPPQPAISAAASGTRMKGALLTAGKE